MARRPAASTRLSAANLASLGAARLAELLIEAGTGNANLKRRLKLELAAEAGPDLLALEIDKRLAALATSRARVSWRKRPELLEDLETHRRMIVERLAPAAPVPAFLALLNWFALFRGLTERVRDPRGEVVAAFEQAAPDLWRLAGQAAEADPDAMRRLADAAAERPLDFGRWAGAGGDALAPETARRLLDALNPALKAARSARTVVRRLADHAGDLDLWLSLIAPDEKGSPDIAAEIARRLLAAGRAPEARSALEAALKPSPLNRRWTFGRADGAATLTPAWERASIDLLDAEGRKAEAQGLRWALFERDLSAPALRAYLAQLPDFEDVEALDRALAHADAYPDFEAALGFLMDWPAHREAAALVERRRREAQRPFAHKADWAARLAQRHPVAAEILSD